MHRLLKIGFKQVGYWELQDGEVKYFVEPEYREIKNVSIVLYAEGESNISVKPLTSSGLDYMDIKNPVNLRVLIM